MTSRHDPVSRVCSRRGFSLVEVMIASLVLVLVFMSCITALQAGFRMVDNSRMANLADQTIQSQIESIKLLNWSYIGGTPPLDSSGNWYFQAHLFTDDLAAATTAGSGWIDFLPQIRSVVGNVNSAQLGRITRFRMSVVDSTDPTTAAARTNVKRIKVELAWRGLNGQQTFTREFETFYAKDGASDFYYTGVN
jgi:prepilin-type N-terminal cleavage/methylation domain-containing protein